MEITQREVIGVDIGGSNIKVARVLDGKVIQSETSIVNREDSKQRMLTNLLEVIDLVMTSSVVAIGIGVPAVVDVEHGVVYDVQNIPAWKKIALKEFVQNKYKVPVYINNDANCFALGEQHFGKALNFKNCVALSLGTGMGMGIIIEGKLYNGVMSGAGEVGMVPYLNGIMEQYTGSFFFEKYYNQSAKSLYDKALLNDVIALQAFESYGKHLGEAIKIILYMYAPEAIIIGGSISNSYPFFEKTLRLGLDSFAYPKQIEHLKIEKSDLVDSPVLGAAALCLYP